MNLLLNLARQMTDQIREGFRWPKIEHQETLRDLELVFKRGRTSFAKAYEQPSVENFHEWRKQVKHLLYLSRVLGPLWSQKMAVLGRVKGVGQFLGEDHDLALLREKVSGEASLFT